MLFHMYGKPRINVSALKGLGILENRKNQITLENCKLLGSNEKRNSIAVPCILFDFVRNGNYSAIDSCFYLYTVTSIDHLGTKIAIVQLIKHVFFFTAAFNKVVCPIQFFHMVF